MLSKSNKKMLEWLSNTLPALSKKRYVLYYTNEKPLTSRQHIIVFVIYCSWQLKNVMVYLLARQNTLVLLQKISKSKSASSQKQFEKSYLRFNSQHYHNHPWSIHGSNRVQFLLSIAHHRSPSQPQIPQLPTHMFSLSQRTWSLCSTEQRKLVQPIPLKCHVDVDASTTSAPQSYLVSKHQQRGDVLDIATTLQLIIQTKEDFQHKCISSFNRFITFRYKHLPYI